MTRLLCRVYGDSLSLPRAEIELDYSQTYPELFKRRLAATHGQGVDLYNRSKGGISIQGLHADFVRDCEYFGTPGGQVVVIQIGIVDCAPRILSNWQRAFLAKVPSATFRQVVVRQLHRHRARLVRLGRETRRVTPPSRFRAAHQAMVSRAARESANVFVMNIAPTTDALEIRSPGIRSSIELYNRIIADCVHSIAQPNVSLIDVHAAILAADGGVGRCVDETDGHHLTVIGHRLYAELVWETYQLAASVGASA